jgi:hypothetical protein
MFKSEKYNTGGIIQVTRKGEADSKQAATWLTLTAEWKQDGITYQQYENIEVNKKAEVEERQLELW